MFTQAFLNWPQRNFSAMQPGEKRVKSAALGDVIQLPDTTLVSPTVVISRQDGLALTGSDMQIVGTPAMDGTGLIASVTLQAGTNLTTYNLQYAANGNISGNPIIRTVGIAVLAAIG